MCTADKSRGVKRQDFNLTSHFHIVKRLRMNGAVLLLPLCLHGVDRHLYFFISALMTIQILWMWRFVLGSVVPVVSETRSSLIFTLGLLTLEIKALFFSKRRKNCPNNRAHIMEKVNSRFIICLSVCLKSYILTNKNEDWVFLAFVPNQH